MSWVSFEPQPLRTREEVARIVHGVSVRRGLDELATAIALMTIAVESGSNGHWWCPWNAKDSTSRNYQFDSQSDDGFSVGYFQQQNRRPGETPSGGDDWWGPMRSRMTLEDAADQFLGRLTHDWRRAADNPALAGRFAQDVQGSGFGERYQQHWDEAWDVLRRALAEAPVPEPAAVTRKSGETVGFVGDPVWLEEVLREALGDRLVVEPDWEKRGTGGAMGDVWGVMIHHTGNINETVSAIRDGVHQPGGFLPGPLAQCLIKPDGTCHLIAVGPCNHAGRGSYPGVGTDCGNRRLIGFECCWPTPRPELPGGCDSCEPWSAPLIITMRDATAAVLRKLGYSSERVIGHKEYAGSAQGKWDPGNLSMDWFRGEVQKDLDGVVFPGEQSEHSPEPDPAPVLPPKLLPDPNPRSDRQLLEDIWDQLRGPGGNGWRQLGGNTVVDYLHEIGSFATDLRQQLDELSAMLEALTSTRPSTTNGSTATTNAAAKKVPPKRNPAKKPPAKKTAARAPARKSPAKKAAKGTS